MKKNNAVSHKQFVALTLAALGVVYGDIGTSPLYALKEVFGGAHNPVPITPNNILGILSLFFWSLMIVVTLKYVSFIMRANNEGEGGIVALMTLATDRKDSKSFRNLFLVTLGLIGAAFFYGDGVITPAISVLSAVEGLELITPNFKPFIVPISITIIVGLFVFQRKGTASVGALFGPIMIVWFVVLAILGISGIVEQPEVLMAVNPLHGLAFLAANPVLGFFALGSVVLCITGAEALYADMGHFGIKPIQVGWLYMVLPTLVINYFGQGALLLSDPAAIENPFFLLAPEWALTPLVILATIATVIASQAVISGAFSMTKQAMSLGYTPRMEVLHTSEDEIGQIYVPAINWFLMVSIIFLILGFQSSSNLAAAYGIAVTGTMFITNILAISVATRLWGWNPFRAFLGALPFLLIDGCFFAANSLKIPDGGWFPLVFGLIVFIIFSTWKRGRDLVRIRMSDDAMELKAFTSSLDEGGVDRVEGTAIFLVSDSKYVPQALLHSLKHYKVIHKHVIFLNVQLDTVPYVSNANRIEIEQLSGTFWNVNMHFGFKDDINIPDALKHCKIAGVSFDLMDTSYFLGRETLIPKIKSDMAYWRELLFVFMYRNSDSATSFYRLPSNRVVELGSQVVL
jgi:KUP system potassium uptake protein